jgi:hypothetical protein
MTAPSAGHANHCLLHAASASDEDACCAKWPAERLKLAAGSAMDSRQIDALARN